MTDPADLAVPPSAPPTARSRHAWMGAVFALLVVAGGAALWLRRSPLPPPVAALPSPPQAQAPAAPAVAPPTPAPPMADGDALLRQQLAALSTDAHLRLWAGQPDILRRLTAAVNLISEGQSPRPVLAFLAPAHGFGVVHHRGELVESPRSAERYDLVTRALTGLNPAGVARIYAQVRPYAQAALNEMSPPGRSLDAVLRSAIGRMTSTEIPKEEPALRPKGLGYVFADPKLEALSPAQKNLLRMGPTNARAVQSWLEALLHALPPTTS